jgi:hypothetical protein
MTKNFADLDHPPRSYWAPFPTPSTKGDSWCAGMQVLTGDDDSLVFNQPVVGTRGTVSKRSRCRVLECSSVVGNGRPRGSSSAWEPAEAIPMLVCFRISRMRPLSVPPQHAHNRLIQMTSLRTSLGEQLRIEVLIQSI